MPQPVLFKQTFLIAILTGVQAVVPAIVAVATLYATVTLFGKVFDRSSESIVIVAVMCLVLVQPPREISTQITSARVAAVTDVIFRWLLLLAVLLAVGYVTKSLSGYPRRVFLTWSVVTPVALIVVTLIMQEIMRHFLLNAFDNRRAIFAGYNNSSLELARRLTSNPAMRLAVAGFFDDRSSERLEMESDAKLIGSLSDVANYVKQNGTDVIFIALPIRHVKRVMNLLDDLRDTTASIYYVPDIFVFDLIQARSGEIHGIPVVAMCETPFYGYRGVAKRLTDIGLSVVILLLLLPLLLLVAVLVKTTSPGPVIFKQRRYGLDGREIAVYKFRTMRVTEDGAHIRQASKRDSRITRVGGALRRSSMDELPQLINVVLGDMNIVGPRPERPSIFAELRQNIDGYQLRQQARPGITGWAQINHSYDTSIDDVRVKIQLDLEYLARQSLAEDIKIMMRTLPVMIFKRGSQ